MTEGPIFIGNTELKVRDKEVSSELVDFEGERFFKISNVAGMRPFLMSIVSDSNHWMFISSNGGITAGRKNSEFALFPYTTDDKLTAAADNTGSKSIFQVHKDNKVFIWEPFSERFKGLYNCTNNLYKNCYGNKIVFEEINHDLNLTFRYQWSSSNQFGFVRKAELISTATSKLQIALLDGLQNILPYGVGSYTQTNSSNLVDAYKRNQLHASSGIGIYALSAIIVDKAEPSEALKANLVWSLGLEQPTYLVSSRQLEKFRTGGSVEQETDVKAEKGAYFIQAKVSLLPNEKQEWRIIANVNQDHSALFDLADKIKGDSALLKNVQDDIELGTTNLISICAAADGLQQTKDVLRDTRHFSNTLFNVMRGGIFDDNYTIEKWDFQRYLKNANSTVAQANAAAVASLPDSFAVSDLKSLAHQANDLHFCRLCLEYLPLKFSRRHGDPSRPWNRFSINTRSEVDGSKILDYEGNWRDIFQNWEALALSYPDFLEGMIHKFLNASTFDGYNPYRVTKGGFDWEIIEPDDPWSYIGYWGDHQIIYLLKFLERYEDQDPGGLERLFDQELFVYANVPYRIKSYEELLQNPKDTIVFDEALDHQIRQEREEIGADGALLKSASGSIAQANFLEKILVTTLAKISNFIPEGGIWMNTQRPEWNDANNALVGNGVSMVTLYYLRRFMHFFQGVFSKTEQSDIAISTEVATFFETVLETLLAHQNALQSGIDDSIRKEILDALGKAGSAYRTRIYEHAFSGEKKSVSIADLRSFTAVTLKYLEHSIAANKREDGLYHAYNLMTVAGDSEVSISYLEEMLEGQVAVLSSGYLSSSQALSVLDGLKASKLFREDQYSYLLYPNKDLPLFEEKNSIAREAVEKSELLSSLIESDNRVLITRSASGSFHFNGNFNNAEDVKAALDQLENTGFSEQVRAERDYVLEVFEEEFNHKAFTGRSGTFYGYEGLGSIYWHMVSKLLLAVQECCQKAIAEGASEEIIGRLLEHYYEINAGIGVHKPPTLYGAFPTDPYSHTPGGKGAQQPGMTGQVKEDFLSRFGELGVQTSKGQLQFDPGLLRRSEFPEKPGNFEYVDVHSQPQRIKLAAGSIAFTYCQVPVIFTIAEEESIQAYGSDGAVTTVKGLELGTAITRSVFSRDGSVQKIEVFFKSERLR